MRLEQLRICGLRCLTDVSLVLDPAINVFIGDNGAGKTSVLEAAFLLSHARSFRSGAREALVQRGTAQLPWLPGCAPAMSLMSNAWGWGVRARAGRRVSTARPRRSASWCRPARWSASSLAHMR